MGFINNEEKYYRTSVSLSDNIHDQCETNIPYPKKEDPHYDDTYTEINTELIGFEIFQRPLIFKRDDITKKVVGTYPGMYKR